MNRKFLVGLGVATSFAWSGAQNSVMAQPEVVQSMPARSLQTSAISVKNVPIKMMAWWIDHAHHEEPISIQQSRLAREVSGYQDFPRPLRIFETLPAGVVSTTAVDSQNSLLVVGSKTGIQAVADAVQKFDTPLRQVEVRVQALEISARDAQNLGLNFSALSGQVNVDRAISMARVPNLAQLQARLQQLKQQKKIKPVFSHAAATFHLGDDSFRVIAIDQLTAKLSTTQSQPATIGTKNKAGRFTTWAETSPVVGIGIDAGFAVTPKINDDKSVTLDLMPLKTMQVMADNTPGALKAPPDWGFTHQIFPLRTLEGFRHSVNFKNGETVAFSGLSPSLFDTDSVAPRKDGNLILLVTARILPRFEEDTTPGN